MPALTDKVNFRNFEGELLVREGKEDTFNRLQRLELKKLCDRRTRSEPETSQDYAFASEGDLHFYSKEAVETVNRLLDGTPEGFEDTDYEENQVGAVLLHNRRQGPITREFFIDEFENGFDPEEIELPEELEFLKVPVQGLLEEISKEEFENLGGEINLVRKRDLGEIQYFRSPEGRPAVIAEDRDDIWGAIYIEDDGEIVQGPYTLEEDFDSVKEFLFSEIRTREIGSGESVTPDHFE